MKPVLILYFIAFSFLNSFAQNIDSLAAFPTSLQETSGLLYFNHKLITHNDSGGENALYEIDTNTAQILRTVYISNANNVDWEDLAQDDLNIYIADFGNNSGARRNLKIYIVSKQEFETSASDSVTASIINFSYDNQTTFTPQNQNTNFDAEALIATDDSLYIFSKNWSNQRTNLYSLPKTAGTFEAKLIDSYYVQGLITGADYDKKTGKIMLCGYSKFGSSFLFEIKDFDFPFVFKGNNTRKNISPKGSVQTEGICATGNNKYFLSSEKFMSKASVLHSFEDTVTFINSIEDTIIIINSMEEHYDIEKIYPNPSQKNITIEGNYDYFEIFSLQGKKLMTTTNDSINIENLAAGIYTIHCFKYKKLKKIAQIEKL